MANTSEEYKFYLSDDYTRLEIEEPEGIRDVQSVLKRDITAHGVFFEFTDSDIKLSFCGEARDFLEEHYQDTQEGGSDALVLFTIERRRNIADTWKEIYSSYVKYTTREIDETYFKCAIEKISEIEDLKNRAKTKISLASTEAISGEAISPISSLVFGMHNKVINKTIDVSSDQGITSNRNQFAFGIGVTSLFNMVRFNFNVQTLAEVNDYFTYPALIGTYATNIISETVGSLFGSDVMKDSYIIDVQESGTIYIDDTVLRFSYIIDKHPGANNVLVDVDLALYYEINDNEPVKISNSYTRTQILTDTINVLWEIDDVNFEVNVGDKVYFFAMGIFSNPSQSGDLDDSKRTQIVMSLDSRLYITQGTTFQNSLSKAYKIHDAVNKCAEVITGKQNVLYSEILGDSSNGYYSKGCLSDLFLMDGWGIRDFTGREPHVTWDNLFKSFNTIWALGYGFEINQQEIRLRLEHFTHFYQDGEIIDLEEVDDYREETEPDLIYNEIALKFQKYANDENRDNTIDDFHTESEWITPIRKNQKSFDKTSPSIMSPFLIEETRRVQFKEKPTESFKYDDDIFLVQGIAIGDTEVLADFDAYNNYLTVPKEYFNNVISYSVNLTVVGSLYNDGDYTYQRTGVTLTETEAIISLDQSLQGDELTTCTISDPNIEFVAEKDQAFDGDGSVTGLISPESSYNLRWTLKRSLTYWSKWIRSSLYYERASQYIKSTFFKNNGELETNLDSNECTIEGEIDQVKENEDIRISTIGEPIWSPDIIKFQKKLDADVIVFIIDAHKNNVSGTTFIEEELLKVGEDSLLAVNTNTNLLLGRNTSVADSRNFGYISCRDFNGVKVSGWLLSMKYNIITEICEFELLKKAEPQTYRKLLESGFAKLLEDGSYKLLENG